MSNVLISHPEGFEYGYTPVTSMDDDNGALGINFGILKLRSGEEKDLTSLHESAYLLMRGKATFSYDNSSYTTDERRSIFDEDPTAIHFSKEAQVRLKAEKDCELAVCQVENDALFATKVFTSGNMLKSEHHGKGMLEETSHRIIRTIFNADNRPESNLVLGEDITFPGRWSSYPPHYHPQPEIYHYRFTSPEGYGHGEVGDDVYKIHNYDTIKILGKKVHPQVAAPGYGMYYIWVIRHLPGNPYTGPVFDKEHGWLLDPKASYWKPPL